jgi:hypothetical protein
MASRFPSVTVHVGPLPPDVSAALGTITSYIAARLQLLGVAVEGTAHVGIEFDADVDATPAVVEGFILTDWGTQR